jgi:hypothetical protein
VNENGAGVLLPAPGLEPVIFAVTPALALVCLNGRFPDFTVADADDFFKRTYKHFSVADFSSPGTFKNSVHNFRHLVVSGDDGKEQIWKVRHQVLNSSINFRSLLLSETFHFGYGEAFYPDPHELCLNIVQVLFPNDSINSLHSAASRPVCRDRHTSAGTFLISHRVA